jgi:Uma2 family endonuclease
METMVKPPRTGMEAFKLMPEGTYCQLINDVLILSPAPTPNHQSALGIIYEEISKFIKAKKLGKLFFSPIDVYLNNTNVFQPDIVFITKDRAEIIDWKKGIMGAPDLVMEVLSKGNEKYDLTEKKTVYEESGVKEYWVVDPTTKWSEGFILENKVYKSLGERNGQLIIQMFQLTVLF